MTTMTQPLCGICHSGYLVRRKKYRMNSIVALIGYIFLIPSFIGMAIAVMGLSATRSAVGSNLASIKKEVTKKMETAKVPGAIVDKVVESEPIGEPELAALTASQKTVVQDCERDLAAATVGTGIGAALAGGFSVVLGVVSLIGGLLGWLLIMKKKVLQCTACGAVVAAS